MKKIIFGLIFTLMFLGGIFYYLNIYEKIDKADQLYVLFVSEDDIDEKKIDLKEYELLKDKNMLQIEHLKKLKIFVDYDREEDIVSLSDGYNIIKYYFAKSELMLNGKKAANSEVIFIKEPEALYVNFDFVKNYFDIQRIIGEERKNILLRRNESNYGVANLEKSKYIFNKDSVLSNIENQDSQPVSVYKSKSGEEYIIGSRLDEYVEIITPNLIYGIIKKDYLQNENIVYNEKENPAASNEKINLTWEYAENGNPNTENIGPMKGLNVISPIWYSMKDSKGNLRSTYGTSYHNWAKSRGYEVWPVVKNNFSNLDQTSEFMRSSSARDTLINKILEDSINKGYDGINVDFENMYMEDKYYFSVFISELATLLRQNNISISVDVTVMDGSDTWSKSIDRAQIGSVIDYLVVMTYDEHWASSPISGSVASYNWVDESIKKIVEVVPSEKVVLGLPFYMRVWSEKPSKTVANKMDVSSTVLTMKYAQSYIDKYELDLIWYDKAKQYYSVYIIDGTIKKIWFEDMRSIQSKIEIVHKYNLAGVASWRRNFEVEDIWNTIDNALNK